VQQVFIIMRGTARLQALDQRVFLAGMHAASVQMRTNYMVVGCEVVLAVQHKVHCCDSRFVSRGAACILEKDSRWGCRI
jgi:hypothetical protein